MAETIGDTLDAESTFVEATIDDLLGRVGDRFDAVRTLGGAMLTDSDGREVVVVLVPMADGADLGDTPTMDPEGAVAAFAGRLVDATQTARASVEVATVHAGRFWLMIGSHLPSSRAAVQ